MLSNSYVKFEYVAAVVVVVAVAVVIADSLGVSVGIGWHFTPCHSNCVFKGALAGAQASTHI